MVHGVKDVVKKPTMGAKEEGASGLVKGLGKGFVGVIARPTSSAADLTSVSCDVIRRYIVSVDQPDQTPFLPHPRTATREEVMHRIHRVRHVGRDHIIRPSLADEGKGRAIFQVGFSHSRDDGRSRSPFVC